MGAALQFVPDIPHSTYQAGKPWQVLVWAGSDLLIVAACIAIAIAILIVLHKRPDAPHRTLAGAVAVLIALYGLSHVMEIFTPYAPILPLTGFVKLATALISLAIAVALLRLIPALTRIPSPQNSEDVVVQLELALADVSRNRDGLETKLRRQTQELSAAKAELADMPREAARRSRNLIQIVSSLTRPGSDAKEYSEGFMRDLRGRINALATATSTVMEQGDMAHASLERVIRRQVEPMFAEPERQLRTQGPGIEVCVQGAQQISLVAWELASRFTLMTRDKQSRGQINVNWLISREQGEDDMLVLEWRETFEAKDRDPLEYMELGDGTCTPELLPEFSERLLTQIVPHLLGGKGRVEIAPSTFIYRLSCPLSAVEDTRGIDLPAPEDEAAERGRKVLGGA